MAPAPAVGVGATPVWAPASGALAGVVVGAVVSAVWSPRKEERTG